MNLMLMLMLMLEALKWKVGLDSLQFILQALNTTPLFPLVKTQTVTTKNTKLMLFSETRDSEVMERKFQMMNAPLQKANLKKLT